MSLQYCNNCREDSMKVKVYTRKDGVGRRAMFCLNKGCKEKIDLNIAQKDRLK